MTDTLLFEEQTGTITPEVGTNTFEVTDPTAFKTVVVDGFTNTYSDVLYLVRRNYADDGWERFTCDGKDVTLDLFNKSRTPVEVGVYGLLGSVAGTLTAYTKE